MKNTIGIYLMLLVKIYAGECEDQTTYGLMNCQKEEISKATKKMNTYFSKALQYQYGIENNKELISGMKEAQEKWKVYEKAECRAVYQQWIHGTIRGLMSGSCSLEMIQQRTRNIFERYLTYEDNSKFVLAKPK